MKWLDNTFNKLIEKIEIKVNLEFGVIKEKIDVLECKINEQNKIINNQNDIIKELKKENIILNEDLKRYYHKNNLTIALKEESIREDMESCLTTLSKNLDRKLDNLGSKKGVVVELLKRIAQLEKDNVSV